MKYFLTALFTFFVLAGCGEKKVDTEKLNRANALVNSGQFEEGIKLLDEMGKDSPKDAALRTSRIQGHMKYASFFMYNDSISQKIKYRSALKHFRAVLKLDPSNTDAKASADMIIDIYKSMGREIPAEE
jgi:hypothetical protein